LSRLACRRWTSSGSRPRRPATAVGAEDDLGTLDPGKLADIVLLDANPIEDIKNTQSIWRVIKGRFVFDPEELGPLSGN